MAETFCYSVDPGCGPKGRPKQVIRDSERFDSPKVFNVRTGRGRKNKNKNKRSESWAAMWEAADRGSGEGCRLELGPKGRAGVTGSG